MTSELKQLSEDQLRTVRTSCREVLGSVIASLNHRSDIQAGIERLMSSGDMVDELNAINAESVDLPRLILQTSVAALVNIQSVEAVDVGEIAKRHIILYVKVRCLLWRLPRTFVLKEGRPQVPPFAE